MKTKLISALLLAATAAQPLLAQDRDHGGRWDGRRDGGQAAPAPAQAAPQPPAGAPQGRPGGYRGAPDRGPQAAPGGDRRGIAVGEPNPAGRWQGQPPQQPRPDRPDWNRRPDAGQPNVVDRRPGADGRWNGGDRDRDGRPDWNRDRNGDGRPDWNGNRPGWNNRDRDRDGRPDWADRNDRRWDDRGGAWRGGGNWSRDWRSDRRYDWRSYRAENRFAFRGPRYYAPRGWSYRRFSIGYQLAPFLYAQQYWISDPYAYRLPPAYGPYRWIRYYDDVLLVDLRSGQVVDMIPDFFY